VRPPERFKEVSKMKKLFRKPDPVWLIPSLISAALLLAAIFLPLWRMELVAPQYPAGLVMYAYGDRFEGETAGYHESFDAVAEINALNHYIGMKPIEEVNEMKLFIPGLLALSVAGIAVSFIAWKPLLVRGLAVAGYWFVPAFFIADLQYWLYNYGHSMDPGAALNTGDITPKVWGTTKVWNFHSQNGFEMGFYAMVLAAVVITFGPLLLGWLRHWRAQKDAIGKDEATLASAGGITRGVA
jgi:hypothetical protein